MQTEKWELIHLQVKNLRDFLCIWQDAANLSQMEQLELKGKKKVSSLLKPERRFTCHGHCSLLIRRQFCELCKSEQRGQD